MSPRPVLYGNAPKLITIHHYRPTAADGQRIQEARTVEVPKILRGSWFSWEGYSKLSELNEFR